MRNTEVNGHGHDGRQYGPKYGCREGNPDLFDCEAVGELQDGGNRNEELKGDAKDEANIKTETDNDGLRD